MRIIPINQNYYRYPAVKSATVSRPVSNSYSVNFRGIWDSKDDKFKTDIFEKFQYGLDALDDSTVFIVCADRERAEHNLAEEIDKINNPIFKFYFLELHKTNPDLKGIDTKLSNFGFYKENGKYYVMGLGGELNGALIWHKNRDFDAEKDVIHTKGPIIELEEGDKISLGIGCNNRLIFNKPKSYNTAKADARLEKIFKLNSEEAIKSFNQSWFINNAKVQKEQAADKVNKKFTFEDVGGLDNVIDELRKFVIRPVNYPQVFENIRMNKGILLYGPPRCGKTLLGKALANEAGVPFKYYNANEFKSATVGSSEESFRNVIENAMQEKQIIFIDEIDAIAKKRDGSHNARYDDSLVNQILGSLSDLEKSNTMSFVMAATNRKDLLDEALIATGRFGLHLEVPMPDLAGIEHIYNIHTKNIKLANDVNIKELAPLLLEAKFNGSDVAEMISVGFFNALERLGLNAKMDAKTLVYDDILQIKVAKEDFLNAIKKLARQKI